MSVTDVREGESALRLDSVEKRFTGLVALRGITFDVKARDIFGLIGPNGAGKTTLINILSGFLRPEEGAIELFGSDITGVPSDRLASIGIARTYQNVRLFEGLSVLQTVEAGAHRHRKTGFWYGLFGSPAERRRIRTRAKELLDFVGVTASPRTKATNLSYGEQRRVEIARALAADPRLLLLDEPAAGMNDKEADALATLIRTIRDSGVTVVLVEHNIRLVLELCDHATVLNFGEMIASGTPRDCLADPDVREAYFGKQSDAARIEALLRVRRDRSG
jgi:branched-chain amino acid transport system ATP-binding protein